MNLRPLKQFDAGKENSFFTMETIGTFAIWNIVIGGFWFLFKQNEQRFLWIGLITFGLMIVYSLLSMEYESGKPKGKQIARAIFLAFFNSAYIVFTVTGITTMITGGGEG